MYNPPHPGATFRDDVLLTLGLNVSEAALQLGVTRAALSRVLNGKASILPKMALRLERWLGVEHGGRASVWLAMQSACGLWNAERATKAALENIKQVEMAPARRPIPVPRNDRLSLITVMPSASDWHHPSDCRLSGFEFTRLDGKTRPSAASPAIELPVAWLISRTSSQSSPLTGSIEAAATRARTARGRLQR
jgi:addiction module HigA family antidote